MEKVRDNCGEKRDLEIIDLLYSTGIRVGELVNLNIDDIDFEGRECVVYGKGDKERRVYFDVKARIHPHKFRCSMATRAIDKGMPIEQVQKILGHSQIDTTMQYAMVNQSNVKTAHQKYMS